MKQAKLIWFLLLLGGIILVGKITNILVFHQLSSNNLLPNYSYGDWVISSSLKKYTYNDVVCFKIAPKHNVGLSRLLAVENDSIEMKDGYILRNGFLADDPDKLVLSYFTRKEIKDFSKFKNLTIEPKQIEDTVIFNLTYNEYKDLSRQYLLRLYRPDLNNFSTMLVPKGYCLVGGDNRSVSSNKKEQELVPVKNIVGTVLR